MVGEHAKVENSLLRAVAKANCTVVALPKSCALELDADQLATEMNRPGAISDLTRVLEASNVERAGLLYTTIGRGTLDTSNEWPTTSATRASGAKTRSGPFVSAA